MKTHAQEIKSGQRYAFGSNWKAFLTSLDDQRIGEAERSLCEMLGVSDLKGKSFIDVGSGSGLFSLVARKLGAEVRSFDFDPTSVACTQELKSRYFPDDKNWDITKGSVLDKEFLATLGKYDIVYSWGVLHHTGSMWEALENVISLAEDKGTLFIAIYNDMERHSRNWHKIKKLYCSGFLGRSLVSGTYIPYAFARACAASIVRKRSEFAKYKEKRGMSIYYDWFDWLGGFPYEYAKVEEIFHYYGKKGFRLANLLTVNSIGCNQFVFVKK